MLEIKYRLPGIRGPTSIGSIMALVRANSSDSRDIILILSFGAFIRDAGQYVVWVIMSIYLNEVRGLPYVEIGLVFLIAGLISVPVASIGGKLIDKIGRRKMIVILPFALSLMSLILFFLVYFQLSLLPIVALFIAVGPLESLDYVTLSTVVSDVTSEAERLSGFSALRIASNLGIGIGLVSGGLLSQLNYSYIFLLSFTGFLVEGALYYFRIPETHRRLLSGDDALEKTGVGLKVPYRDTFFIIISVMVSLSWFFTGMFESPLTPLYMSSVNHFSSIDITVLFAINSVIVITFQKPIDRIMVRVRDSIRIVLGLALYAAAFLIFAEFSIYSMVAIAVVVLTFGENMNAPASSSLITKISPEENRGTYLGFNSSIGSLINPFRPMVGTALLAVTVAQPGLTWIALSIVSIGIAFVFLMSFRRISARRAKLGHSSI